MVKGNLRKGLFEDCLGHVLLLTSVNRAPLLDFRRAGPREWWWCTLHNQGKDMTDRPEGTKIDESETNRAESIHGRLKVMFCTEHIP